MTVEETKRTAYENTVAQFDKLLSEGAILSARRMKKAIADFGKRIRTVELGVMFAKSIEEVSKAEQAIANLQGQKDAFKERYEWLVKKLNENG